MWHSIYKHILEAHVFVWSDLLASHRTAKVSSVRVSAKARVTLMKAALTSDRYVGRNIEGSDQALEWLCQSQCSYKGSEGPWCGQLPIGSCGKVS